jgi:catechol 2,3-dioxygenase-like lactoylglutathione lyase family enzyme
VGCRNAILRSCHLAIRPPFSKGPGVDKIRIDHLDHLVLTVADLAATEAFYQRVMGMTPVSFGEGREALHFGNQKINLHQAGREFEPKAKRATPGSADLCFIVETPLDDVIAHLKDEGVVIIHGPVAKTGATGPLRSVYIRDPDGNLIEFSNLVRR